MENAPLHHAISTAPDGGIAHWVTTDDDLRLRIGYWTPHSKCKGTALFFPGRGDYIELYGPPVRDLVEAGYAVAVIDWRGHGLSDRVATNPKVGHVSNFEAYQRDVKALVEATNDLNLPKPNFLIAHSMGACIGLRALINDLDVQAAVFSAPMYNIRMAAYERIAAWPLTWLMTALGRGQAYAPGFDDRSYVFRNAFDGNTLTNSIEHYERWIMQGKEVPDLHTGGPSMAWLLAALRETRALIKLESPSTPCLTFCGDQDVTVSVAAIENRMGHWRNGELVFVPNAKHELFLENDDARKLVMAKAVAFFDDHCL